MSKLQQHIGAILDAYGLPNIRALQEKIADLKAEHPDSREAQLLEFVVALYKHDCDSQT
jgi:hypothetical protein